MDAAAFKPLLGVISESLNCSITLAVTAAEMASVMADFSVLLWMDLCKLGFSPIFSFGSHPVEVKIITILYFLLDSNIIRINTWPKNMDHR